MNRFIAFWLLSCGLAVGAMQACAESNVRLAADTPLVSMAEWEVQQAGAAEQTGARILIAAGPEELQRAPAKAAHYESQAFKFNNGEIRILSFHKAGGGVLHQITTETQLYVIKGSATVGVAGQNVEIHAGDVVNLPSGVLRSIPKAVEDTTLLLHNVRSSQPGAKAAVLHASDTPASPLTAGPKVGVDNVKVSVQRFTFDGNSIRVARLVGPGKTGVVTPPVDALIYLLSGRMEITIGEEVKIVKAGDAICEAAGLATHWDVLEESSFVATNGAKAAP
jgi:quercetin dioxygenase-like cupin family protein